MDRFSRSKNAFPASAPAADRLKAALSYARRDWPVFPLWWPTGAGRCACGRADCSNAGKHPLVRRGFHAATTEPDLIRRWWASWPLANVGIRTGAASGLLVVDIDGAAGRESLQALVGEHGAFRAMWARSGSGGWHAYLRLPEGQRVGSSVGRLGPGLDVRADGASIIAPPSAHASGDRYHWRKRDGEPPTAPQWLVRLALSPPTAPPWRLPATWQAVDRVDAAVVRREADAVAVAPAGTRNHRLNLAAWRLGRLAAGGVVDEMVAREALLAAATAAGLPLHESTATVRSGMTAGRRRPLLPSPRSAPSASAVASSRPGARVSRGATL